MAKAINYKKAGQELAETLWSDVQDQMDDYYQILLDDVQEYDEEDNAIPISKADKKIVDDAFQSRLISLVKVEHPSIVFD
jgi:hypothetical protein